MTAALSIDFGNSYTKVGFRTTRNRLSDVLNGGEDLPFDEDHICIPTVAARTIRRGREQWHYGTEVKEGLKADSIQVYRNWKPRFFQGHETRLREGQGQVRVECSDGSEGEWGKFTDEQLETLVAMGTLFPAKQKEVQEVLKMRKASHREQDLECDYEMIGRGFFSWLRGFVEPLCRNHGIATAGAIPVRITLPSFGANSARAQQTLLKILRETGWNPTANRPALPEPVANLIGTFSGGRNKIWRAPKPGSPECCNLHEMIGGSSLFKAIREFVLSSRGSRPPIYWILIADLGGYTCDLAMVGFDLDNVEVHLDGKVDGKKLLGHYSEPIGVHDLDQRVRQVLTEEHRKGFEGLSADVDGRRIEGFHRVVYRELRPYDTGKGLIGRTTHETSRITDAVHQFAEHVATIAIRFLLIEQYDHIDELILTGGGCQIPLVGEAIERKLQPYNLKQSHVPVLPVATSTKHRCHELERKLVRGATALGATSVFFDYD
jgi:hypothetical protein